jgi:hypothetical protein
LLFFILDRITAHWEVINPELSVAKTEGMWHPEPQA